MAVGKVRHRLESPGLETMFDQTTTTEQASLEG
jgi:hypothetical protein